jgi:nucleotide-binding universal stress UspA family protein
MIGFRSLLCPVDFSEPSRRALAHALALARRYEGRITLLTVVPDLPSVVGFPLAEGTALDPTIREEMVEDLREIAVKACEQAPVDAVVAEGDPARTIIRHAREMGADIVVMGTHGRSGFERWMLGSVTEKVLRTAHCPVLAVPMSSGSPEDRVAFRRILCPVDFSPSALHAVKQAVSLAEGAKAELTLLHVVDWLPDRDARPGQRYDEFRDYVERDALRRLRSLVPPEARDGCAPREAVAFGTPWREVLRRAAEGEADVVVMGVHGHGAVEVMLFGSTTQHVVRHCACPVLTIRAA